jgi:hypothetical protein
MSAIVFIALLAHELQDDIARTRTIVKINKYDLLPRPEA